VALASFLVSHATAPPIFENLNQNVIANGSSRSYALAGHGLISNQL